MTVVEYYAAVRALGLTPDKKVPNVFWSRENSVQSVPDPEPLPIAVRVEIIERLRELFQI